MKYVYSLLFMLCALNISAQSILNELQKNTNSSEGVIRVECSAAIAALIGSPATISSNSSGEVVRSGYRIQVFMGSKLGTARNEATSKQTAIRDAFPTLPTYLLYVAPNWKLLAGDFTTREEANLVKQQLQRAFPEFGQEIYIVSSPVKINFP